MILTKKEILSNLGCVGPKCLTPPDKNKIEMAKLEVLIDIRDALTELSNTIIEQGNTLSENIWHLH